MATFERVKIALDTLRQGLILGRCHYDPTSRGEAIPSISSDD